MAIDTTSIGTAPRTHVPTPAPSADPVEPAGPSAPRVTLPRFGPGLVRYQPAIDGLRAVAVLAVLAYHWPASWMPGGFLGVEVFFVISGYLITSLLLGERVRTGGTDFKQFWIRRARRLLPALYALLVVVSAAWLIWHPTEVAGLRGAVAAAAAYVSNWYLIAVKQSYFESVSRPSPLLHLWSLAVEEQFYLIWPLALAGLVRLFRRRMRLVLLATLALAAGSAALGMVALPPGSRSLPHLVRHRHPRRRHPARCRPGHRRASVADAGHRASQRHLPAQRPGRGLAGRRGVDVRPRQRVRPVRVPRRIRAARPAHRGADPVAGAPRRPPWCRGPCRWGHWCGSGAAPTASTCGTGPSSWSPGPAWTCPSGAGSCSGCAWGPRWWRPSCPTGSWSCRCATVR